MGRCDCSIFVPKKFFCYFSLKIGTQIIGIVGFCVMMLVTFVLTVQVFMVKYCKDCDEFLYRQAYSIHVVACIYALIMAIINLWLLWGVQKEKPSVVLSWVVINIVWHIETTTVLIVMLCMHRYVFITAAWLVCLIIGFIGFGLEIYTLLVVYAYWLELKTLKEQVRVTNQ